MVTAATVALGATIAGAAVIEPSATTVTPNLSSMALPAVTPAAVPTQQTFPDPTGQSTTLSLTGAVPATHPFFASQGPNGRACSSCHRPEAGWSITPQELQTRFLNTNGLDPVFRTVDGSNSPLANVSTVTARRAAYSMLLTRGDIRVGLPVPRAAEFTLARADDPYHFASSAQLSLFRRPLPATNLRFLSTVMWDGRETGPGASILTDLRSQAFDAIVTHEQAIVPPSATTIDQIVAFESGLYSTQTFDSGAGSLSAAGALGSPGSLSSQPFFIGINDPNGGFPAGSTFNPRVFSVFNTWASTAATADPVIRRRQSIARGQAIFNTRPFQVDNVGGFNDVLHRPLVTATCSTCHNAPNAGSHSLTAFMNLGLTDPVRRTPDMPLYTLRNNATGALRQTMDPGRALVTGRWSDIGEFKIPTLRDLPARAPYFHDGSAATTADVINFYDRRFRINLNPQERVDLKAFLDSI